MLSIRGAFFTVLLAFTLPAHADSYAFYNLGNANEVNITGLDSAGDVLVETDFCPSQSCWDVFSNGVLVSQTDTMPAFDFDNGTPCKPSQFALRGACNNGYEAYLGDPLGSTGIFTGPDSTSLLSSGWADMIGINSEGDIVWMDGESETQWEAIDLTSRSQISSAEALAFEQTPEPSSFVLLGTGLLALAGASFCTYSSKG